MEPGGTAPTGRTGPLTGQEPRVYTLGRVLVDLYANQLNTPLAGVRSFNKYLGGSAANTAFGLARLGAPVGLISRVGPDDFGRFLLQTLQEAGVDTSMVKTDPRHPTALAFAAIFPPGESHLLFYRKPCADIKLSVEDIDFDRLRRAPLLSVAATALSESPSREAVFAALEEHRRAGGTNVVDVDWRPMLWDDPHSARIYYRLALQMADIVVANTEELEMAGGSPDPGEAARNLLRLGARQVVAKRGSEGVLLFGEGGPLEVRPLRVRVVNTLGAGDAFGAAYLYGLLNGWEAERRLQFANAAGAIVAGRHSCSEAMPTLEEVETLLQGHRGGE